jgi:aminoglycoside phosphotransferase (APT) family kinase protein
VPVVFQHGDPGSWNALLRPDGGVAFLDWENFEPEGIPLWDLFYLVRSVVADGRAGPLRRIVDRATGGRRVAIARRYRAVREHDPVVRDAVARYCQTIGLEPELVGPLERLGWAYQALKEATRLPLGRGAHGASQAMLRSMRGGGWEEAT